MGLRAHTSLYGEYEKWISRDVAWSEKDGNHYKSGTYSVPILHQAVERWGYTRNPIRLLPGGTPWRDPSSYTRGILQCDQTPGRHYFNLYNGWYVEDRTVYQDGYSWIANLFGMGTKWGKYRAIDDPADIAESEVKALNRLGGEKAALGVSFAEAGKTFDELAGYSLSLVKALRAARRGSLREVASHLGISWRDAKLAVRGHKTANVYLGLKYGWLPLMSDIKSTHSVLMDQIQKDLLVFGKAGVNWSDSVEIGDTPTASRNYTLTGKSTRKTITKITAVVRDDNLHFASRIGVANPLSFAWELVPFSFVVDWFIPVGNTLDALSAVSGLDFVGGHTTVVGELDAHATYYQRLGEGSPVSLQLRGKSVKRTALKGFPMPKLYGNRNPFKTSNALSAVALLRKLL